MRVLELSEYGGPKSLQEARRPAPKPPAEGIVIAVEAIGINFPDLLATQGLYQYKPDLPYVPGCEVAGTVVAAGKNSRISVGERVASFVWEGGYAEQVAAPDRQVMSLPDSISWEAAAGLVVNYQTVHFGLKERGQLKAGENLLVLGAGGGIGTAAIQVGRGLGARVVAAVRNEEKAAAAREAGAEELLLAEGNFSETMREMTGGRGFDVVLDPLGDRFFDEALRGLAPLGRLLVVGFAAGSIPQVAVNRILLRNATVAGVAWGAYLDVDATIVERAGHELTNMFERAIVKPQIHEGARFEEIPKLLELLAQGKIRGKAVALAPGRLGTKLGTQFGTHAPPSNTCNS